MLFHPHVSQTMHDIWFLSIPVLEKMLRPIIVYFFLLIVLRAFGKRQLAQVTPFDLVVLLCLANTVQNSIIGDDNSVSGGLIGAFVLLLVNYGVIRLLRKDHPACKKLREWVRGKTSCLITPDPSNERRGILDEHKLAHELMTREDLNIIAHRYGYKNSDSLKVCNLDPGGLFYIEGDTEDEINDDKRHRKYEDEANRRHQELKEQIAALTDRIEKMAVPR